jgi:hypothetical protein
MDDFPFLLGLLSRGSSGAYDREDRFMFVVEALIEGKWLQQYDRSIEEVAGGTYVALHVVYSGQCQPFSRRALEYRAAGWIASHDSGLCICGSRDKNPGAGGCKQFGEGL